MSGQESWVGSRKARRPTRNVQNGLPVNPELPHATHSWKPRGPFLAARAGIRDGERTLEITVAELEQFSD